MGVACTINTTHIMMDKYVNGSKYCQSMFLFTCQILLPQCRGGGADEEHCDEGKVVVSYHDGRYSSTELSGMFFFL